MFRRWFKKSRDLGVEEKTRVIEHKESVAERVQQRMAEVRLDRRSEMMPIAFPERRDVAGTA